MPAYWFKLVFLLVEVNNNDLAGNCLLMVEGVKAYEKFTYWFTDPGTGSLLKWHCSRMNVAI